MEEGNTLSEEYQIRLILEIIMWGGLAIALEVGCNLAGLALTADTEFPDAPGNSTGLFRVDVTFFSVTAIIRIVSAFFKCFMVGANMQFYATRLAEYDKEDSILAPADGDLLYLDIAMIIMIPFLFAPYIYKMTFAIIDCVQWVQFIGETKDIQYYEMVSFFEDVDPEGENYDLHLFSWLSQYFANPEKFEVISDLCLAVTALIPG
jgi:hypothetical protein